MFLERLQGQWLHHLPGQPIAVPDHRFREVVFPNIQPERSLAQLEAIPSSPITVSWFCNFAIGIPHHNIMDKREELRIPEDLTVREGRYITEDTSSGCAWSFSLLLAARERSGCAFQAVHLHQVRLSVSETLSLSLSLLFFRSLSFHLIYYPYSQLDCIISCHLAFQHHS